jgi:hypothetical protein
MKRIKFLLWRIWLLAAIPASGLGQTVWVKRAGGGSTDLANGLWVDKNQHAFLAGSISGQARFFRTQVASAGGGDVVIARFDPAGMPVWVKNFGGTRDDFARAITGDPEGNLYVTGVFTDTAAFGRQILTARGTDVFVVKLDAEGSVVWARALGTLGTALPEAIAVTDQGAVYVGGLFSGTYDSVTRRQMGQTDGFVTRLDQQGDVSWTRVYGGPGFDEITMLSTDPWGRVIVGGNFDQMLFVDDNQYVSSTSRGAFLIRLEGTGNVLWTRLMAGVDAQTYVADAVTDLEGTVYVTGKFSGETLFMDSEEERPAVGQTDVFLMAIKTDGSAAWVNTLGGSEVDEAFSIRLSEDKSDLLVAGSFNKYIETGRRILKGEHDNQLFLARFDRRGNLDEVRREPFHSAFKLEGKYLDFNGNFWACGSFTGSARFGTEVLKSAGEEDLFIAGISDRKVAR